VCPISGYGRRSRAPQRRRTSSGPIEEIHFVVGDAGPGRVHSRQEICGDLPGFQP
jgi:hypothetical protein